MQYVLTYMSAWIPFTMYSKTGVRFPFDVFNMLKMTFVGWLSLGCLWLRMCVRFLCIGVHVWIIFGYCIYVLCVCVNPVCVCVYMHRLCVHVCPFFMDVYVYRNTIMYMCVSACMNVFTCVCVSVCLCVCVSLCKFMCVRACVWIYVSACMYICIYVYMYRSIDVFV